MIMNCQLHSYFYTLERIGRNREPSFSLLDNIISGSQHNKINLDGFNLSNISKGISNIDSSESITI